jgi:hypothetical protein
METHTVARQVLEAVIQIVSNAHLPEGATVCVRALNSLAQSFWSLPPGNEAAFAELAGVSRNPVSLCGFDGRCATEWIFSYGRNVIAWFATNGFPGLRGPSGLTPHEEGALHRCWDKVRIFFSSEEPAWKKGQRGLGIKVFTAKGRSVYQPCRAPNLVELRAIQAEIGWESMGRHSRSTDARNPPGRR